MRSKWALTTALFVLITLASVHRAAPVEGSPFTLQVGSFTDLARAESLAQLLIHSGENPYMVRVDLGPRGYWTRVFIGTFSTIDAARQYGKNLLTRALVPDYLIKSIAEINREADGRLSATHFETVAAKTVTALTSSPGGSFNIPGSERFLDTTRPRRVGSAVATPSALPASRGVGLSLSPPVNATTIPQANPVSLALKLMATISRTTSASAGARGGLWVSGDLNEALARLRWIAGPDAASMIYLNQQGEVIIDEKLLAAAAGVERSNAVDAPLKVTNFVARNEGLLLLAQLTHGAHSYRLHIGRDAPTRGGAIEVGGGVNLDSNYDRRINPHRPKGIKLDSEQPPAGVDSLIAMNPTARWFNLLESCMVPVGHVTFHELAEAHAKLELGLEYLPVGWSAGAHEMALIRERRLKEQRPFSVVLTAGSNRVLKTEVEIRRFYTGSTGSGDQR